MIPYWKSNLPVHAAQRYSKDGVAVLGNPAMRDVIWKEGDSNPQMWINKGYKEQNAAKFINRLGWVPNDPNQEYIDYQDEIFEEYAELKPVNSKWQYNSEQKVWRYDLNGNWAEVANIENEQGWCETVLFIKGKRIEYLDCGWREREDAMGYAEWQIEHPDGPKLGLWSMIWRFSILGLLLFTCFLYPWWLFAGYCILSYTVMGYLLLSGQLSTVGSVPRQILSGFCVWLLSPIMFIYILIWSCFAIL